MNKNIGGIKLNNRVYFEKIVSEKDFEYFSKLVFNEKVMVMNFGRIFTKEEASISYESLMKVNKNHKDFGTFKIFQKSNSIFIGLASIFVNDDFTKAEIEYMLLPEYWGHGYGSEIVEVLLDKAKKINSIKQVTAITDPGNIGSKKILMKNGFLSIEIYKIDDGSLAQTFIKKII